MMNLDVLYAALNQDEDDINPDHDNDELSGVDEEDKEDANNYHYNPEQDSDKDSEDEDSDDTPYNDTPAIELIYDNANVNGQTEDNEEIQGVDDKILGVDETEEIPGVEDTEEISGVDDETQRMDNGHENELNQTRLKTRAYNAHLAE